MGVRFPGEVSSVKTTGSLPLRSLYFRDKQQNKQLYEMLLGKKKYSMKKECRRSGFRAEKSFLRVTNCVY